MSDPEIQSTLTKLKEWCEAEYGRQAEIARVLGVSRQLVTDWFRGKAIPTWSTGLKIQAFLKTQKPGKSTKE